MRGMYEPRYRFFSAGEMAPRGWLRRQLEIQAAGLSGHLHEVWPDVRDSAWIGGKAEGWERVPYWLDGLIPLAWLLRDERLKAVAKRYMDAIMDAQSEDGWICPCRKEERAHYDTWAVILICKALMVYHQCSGDARAVEAAYRAMRNLSDHIQVHTLFNWGQSRWFEAMLPLQWLWELRPEPWMEELAVTMHAQGFSWRSMFRAWHDQEPDAHGVWRHQTHIVNLMMALKSEAVVSGLTGEDPDAFAMQMYTDLLKYHGTPIGHIQGDECLAGKSPVRGTELCSIVEAMYSCEVLFSITGNPFWMDLVESLGFNSLPATISEDMWTHQYDQMLNQISCTIQQEPPVFGTNRTDANLFGLEPDFGCCTANFNQGWPKLAMSAFMRTEEGILSAVPVPSQVHTRIGDQAVSIALDTDYPFRDNMRYTIRCGEGACFEFAIRIPGGVRSAAVNGQSVQPGTVWKEKRAWKDGETIDVKLEMQPEWVQGYAGLRCLRRGPLVFALPVPGISEAWEYVKDGVERKMPWCDYLIRPAGEWRYGFAGDRAETVESEISDIPFSRKYPPVQLKVDMVRVDWDMYPGQSAVCADLPGNAIGEKVSMLLSPYGCTTLRMTLMPQCGK